MTPHGKESWGFELNHCQICAIRAFWSSNQGSRDEFGPPSSGVSLFQKSWLSTVRIRPGGGRTKFVHCPQPFASKKFQPFAVLQRRASAFVPGRPFSSHAPWFRFLESYPEFNILTSDYKIRFWKCDTVINNKPISWSQNRCGLSRANRGEILNTWLKLWVTWIYESHFMNVPFIKIEILTGCLISNCLLLNNSVSVDGFSIGRSEISNFVEVQPGPSRSYLLASGPTSFGPWIPVYDKNIWMISHVC